MQVPRSRYLGVAAIILFEVISFGFFLLNAPPRDLSNEEFLRQTSPNVRRCISTRHRQSEFVHPNECVTALDRMNAMKGLLAELKSLMGHTGLIYWLNGDSLKAQHHSERALPWDLDVSVGVLQDSELLSMDAMVPDGYKLVIHEDLETPSRFIETHFGFYIRLFVFVESKPGMLGSVASRHWQHCKDCVVVQNNQRKKQFEVRRDWILPVQPCYLNSREMQCPAHRMAYLKHIYGDKI